MSGASALRLLAPMRSARGGEQGGSGQPSSTPHLGDRQVHSLDGDSEGPARILETPESNFGGSPAAASDLPPRCTR